MTKKENEVVVKIEISLYVYGKVIDGVAYTNSAYLEGEDGETEVEMDVDLLRRLVPDLNRILVSAVGNDTN